MRKLNYAFRYVLLLSIIVLGCNKDVVEDIYLDPNAGASFLDIENDGYVVTLGATPPEENQTGTWRIYVGENGRFENVNDPKSKFYGEPGEVYSIGWEISQGKEYKADVISVSFKPMNPVLKMQVSDTIHNNISLHLKAEEPKFGATGEWTVVEGSASSRIEDATNSKAAFIGIEDETYTVRWSLKYGSKVAFEEFTFRTDELRAFAGEDDLDIKTEKFAEKFYDLNAFLPAGATAEWEIVEGEGGMVYNTSDPKSLFGGNPDVAYKLLWKVALDNRESIDTLDLRFRGKWGVFVDKRDNQTYKYTEINGLEWMAENFNYAIYSGSGSWYYGNAERSYMSSGNPVDSEEDRKYYGRLYNHDAALDAAPEGWRLPTKAEWDDMLNSFGGQEFAGPKIVEGGSSGMNLSYGGYFDIFSMNDPALRNEFKDQGVLGIYWLADRSSNGLTSIVLSYKEQEAVGHTYGNAHGFGMSVRYVRDVQNN